MVRWIARLVLTVFFNTIAVVDVIGMENIPAQGSYVAVSNHLGRLDPALVYYILPRKDVYLMVAEKYQKYAFVRWLVKHLNGMFIDRYNADFRALRLMLERLQAGGVVALAPEGTRSRSVALIQAWPGASYLAAKAGVPVLPVAVTGTEDVVVKDRSAAFQAHPHPLADWQALYAACLDPARARQNPAAIHRRDDVPDCRPAAACLPRSLRRPPAAG